MRLNKIFLFTTFFVSLGIYAVDGPTIKNDFASKIKVHIIDRSETIYETREIQSGTSITMKHCFPGRLVLVDWGVKEKDGRPRVIGSILKTDKSCSKKYIFTPTLDFVEDKDVNLNSFIPR